MKVRIQGVSYDLPEDITKEELVELFTPEKPPEPEPTKEDIKPPTPEPKVEESVSIGNEMNAFEMGFVAGEEVVDEAGVRFKVDRYGRFIEV